MRAAALSLVVVLAGAAGAARAVPVEHAIEAGRLSASLAASFDATVHSNLGSFPIELMVSGAFSSTPDGHVAIDWGAPGWTGALASAPGDVSMHGEHTVTGSSTVQDVGEVVLALDFAWELALASSFHGPTTRADPDGAGTGPWQAGDRVDLVLAIEPSFRAALFGRELGAASLDLAADGASDVAVVVALSRADALAPGTRVEAAIPDGFSVSFAASPHAAVAAPGCELPHPLPGGGCLLDVTSVVLEGYALALGDLGGTVRAEQHLTSVPEPATTVLLTGGLACLARARRRSRPWSG